MQHQDPLKNLYLLRDADADDLTAVAALAKRQRFRAGERIFHEGDEAHAMYLVALGTVEILVSGDETMVAVIGSGGEFGEIAFFDRGKRSASARARETSEIVSLPYEGLRRVLAERPGLSLLVHRNACTFLARCLRQTSLDLSFARELNRRRL